MVIFKKIIISNINIRNIKNTFYIFLKKTLSLDVLPQVNKNVFVFLKHLEKYSICILVINDISISNNKYTNI